MSGRVRRKMLATWGCGRKEGRKVRERGREREKDYIHSLVMLITYPQRKNLNGKGSQSTNINNLKLLLK